LILREAGAADWPEVANFFLETPLQSGTSFVLDRRPDFGALPALRGKFRTFVVFQERRLAGAVTALWHPARIGARCATVGEVMDLRVAPWARGGRAMFHLLRAAYDVFVAERVDWIVCLVGKDNRPTLPLVEGRIGLPRLEALEDFASVHFIAGRIPRTAAKGVTVREAQASDAALIAEFCVEQVATECFAPPELAAWPDLTGLHRAWLAFEPDGTPCGALMIWDGDSIRRVRIMRYRAAELPLRMVVGVAARLGLTNPLPAPGAVFGLWATRVVAIRRGGGHTLRALLDAALPAAAAAGQSVLQLNLRARDPLLRRLPPYPRSTYWTTLYGGPCDGGPIVECYRTEHFHADLARV
jgi:Acetyltransferase (GNAT) family